jgi:hypothetical protein
MEATRRHFLSRLGIGAVIATMGGARAATAQTFRILPEVPSGDRTFVVGAVSRELEQTVDGLRVGAMRRHDALSVFWLDGAPAAPLDVATLDEARARGDLVIAEREQARVPDLIVDNRGKGHVLLLAGEILIGGKQNRVLSEDILLPPLSGPRALGVYCVEQGRWDGRRREFDSRGSFAPPAVRSEIIARRDQSSVWTAVSRSVQAAQAPSPTGSLQMMYDKREVRDHVEDVERGLDQRAPAGVLGAAVFTGTTLAGVDVFLDPSLFAREWPKLLRAYAVDLYGQKEAKPTPEATLRARVETTLQAARKSEGVLRENAGVGRLFEFRSAGGVKGSALVFEGRVVHTAMV